MRDWHLYKDTALRIMQAALEVLFKRPVGIVNYTLCETTAASQPYPKTFAFEVTFRFPGGDTMHPASFGFHEIERMTFGERFHVEDFLVQGVPYTLRDYLLEDLSHFVVVRETREPPNQNKVFAGKGYENALAIPRWQAT